MNETFRALAVVLAIAALSPGRPTEAWAQGFARRRQPSPYVKLLARGARQMKAGQLEAAIATFGQAIKLSPKDARGYYQRGVCLARRKRLDDAALDYRRAIARNARFAEAHNNLGALLTEQGKAELAVKELREATRLKADYGLAWYNLGLALSDLRQYAAAAQAYRRAARLRPKDVDIQINLGATLQRLKDVDGALRHLAKAVQLRPDDALARTGYGDLLLKKGRVADARVQLEAATRADPSHVRAWRRLAAVHVQQKDFAGALRVLAQARQKIRRSAALALAVAQVHRRWGKPAQAVAAAQRALRLDRKYARAYLVIGLIEAERGHCKQARQAFGAFARLRPQVGPGGLKKLMKRCKAR